MAELALSTLEKWNQMIPKEQLNEFLSLVLPSLDDYLKSGLNDGAGRIIKKGKIVFKMFLYVLIL